MLFDRELRAPLSGPYLTNDIRLKRSAASAKLQRLVEGGFRLEVNGLSYERAGYDGEHPQDRLDPDAPFK
jgi:hypothetical protein